MTSRSPSMILRMNQSEKAVWSNSQAIMYPASRGFQTEKVKKQGKRRAINAKWYALAMLSRGTIQTEETKQCIARNISIHWIPVAGSKMSRTVNRFRCHGKTVGQQKVTNRTNGGGRYNHQVQSPPDVRSFYIPDPRL
jgi:hypothetical protein